MFIENDGIYWYAMVGDIDAVAVNCASACSIYATCDIVLQRKRVSAATST